VSATLPNAIPAFISLCRGALPSGFQIIYRPNLPIYVAPQQLLISGAKFTKDDPVTMGPPFKHEEMYGIQCSLTSSYGDDDELSRMNEVYGLYKTLAQTVSQNASLSGTVLYAWPRQLGYTPKIDPRGRAVGCLDFEIKCDTRVDPTN
jgi:hypothetical protein